MPLMEVGGTEVEFVNVHTITLFHFFKNQFTVTEMRNEFKFFNWTLIITVNISYHSL